MISRLALTDFRNHSAALIDVGPGVVLLSGPNGAGKTNILEAVSMLVPGRGLRRSPLREMARIGGPGDFAISAHLGDGTAVGTGTLPSAPDRRTVRINGATSSVRALSDRLSVLWLTPAMDRLFSGPSSDRRRFLDRLTLALEPGHASHAARYEAAMRARTKLLATGDAPDPGWVQALERAMAEHGIALAQARERTVVALRSAIAGGANDGFPRAGVALAGWNGADLQTALMVNRARDAAAGRATEGPHRQDLEVSFADKGIGAAMSSTGEQKALLLGLILAHADLVAERRGTPPVLLLDEVAAHLDPDRRALLFGALERHGQVWLTATDYEVFSGIEPATMLRVADGRIEQ